MKKFVFFSGVVLSAMLAAGCMLPKSGDNTLAVSTPLSEPAWIRNGDPIQFEGEHWFPTDEVENLMDNELFQAGVYRDVVFYIDKTDVKPIDRLYTRFAKNRYRAFERRE